MAGRLGASFLRCALGAVHYAGSCFQASRILDGLRELSPESLAGGMQRGIAEVARGAGMSPREIEHALPAGEIHALLQRVAGSQQHALAAWQMHAGQLGGLLAGVAELTVDGRAPDASLCLERLAKKVVRDPALAEPFAALSRDVALWEDLMQRCRATLDDGGALVRAQKRRAARRVAVGASLAVIVLSCALVGVQLFRFRTRVLDVLAQEDPCAAFELTDRDLSRVTSDLGVRVYEKRVACEAVRAEAARVEEKRRARAAYEARCEALASHVEAGRLEADDAAIAGDAAALADRIAHKALDAGDFGPGPPALPCSDTPSASRFTSAFLAAVVASPPVWMAEGVLSPAARDAIVQHAAALPVSSIRNLAFRAEVDATRAIVTGEATVLARAERLCALEVALGVEAHSSCLGVLAMAAKR